MKIESPIVIGVGVSTGGTIAGFAAKAVPILQMLSMTAAIVAGIFAALLSYTRWRKERDK